jgi:hypothetical protein
MEFPANATKPIAIDSNSMPMIPGKEFELSFWAKADTPFHLNISMDCQFQPHRPKHLYKQFNVAITQQWKQYSLRTQIPTDEATYPDLQAKLMFIRIYAKNYPEACKVYFDNMRVRLVPEGE